MTKMRGQLSFFLVLILLFGCTQKQPVNVSQKLDNSNETPKRIITLAPHLTELLFSLGVQEKIIATVEFSDYPEAANNIPRIGDAFRIDWELLATLKPDLILAWNGGNPQSLILELERRGYRVASFPNASLFDLPQQLDELSRLLKVKNLSLSDSYKQGLQELVNEYKHAKSIEVFYQVSSQPIYSVGGGHTISEMLSVCGGRNVFVNSAVLASPLSPEAVLGANPDVILTGDSSYPEVKKMWDQIESISQEDILSVSGDEVARASLRMLQGTKNICEALDAWRKNHFSKDVSTTK